jgi:O-antigen ligase
MTVALQPPRSVEAGRRAGLAAAGVVLVAGGGWLAAELPIETVAAVAGALVLAIAIVAKPQLGPLAVLALVAIVPVETLFERDVGFLSGGLKVTDLLSFATVGAWLTQRALHPASTNAPSRAVRNLLLAFVVLAGVGVVTALVAGVQLKFALLELRGLLTLLLVFPLVDAVRRLRDLEWGVSIFLVAVAVGAVVVIDDFRSGGGEIALYSDDATRVNNLVFLYPMAGVTSALALIPFERRARVRLALLALTAVNATALYFTLRRGAWVVVLLAPILVFALLPSRLRPRAARNLVAMAAAGVALVVVVNRMSDDPIESPLDTARERLFSVFESDDDVSTRHRGAEFDRAVELIGEHPITGIGLGQSITFVSPLYDRTAEASNVPHTNIYVHNSYAWVATKLGLPALAVFLALLVTVLRRGYLGYRRALTPRGARLLLGVFVTLVAVAIESLSEPHLTFVGSTPLFAGLIAMIELVPRLEADAAE